MTEKQMQKIYDEELKGYRELKRLVDRNIYRLQQLKEKHVAELRKKGVIRTALDD